MKFIKLLLLLGLWACQDVEENIALEIYVADRFADIQTDAQVTLYRNQEDWTNEQNPLQSPKMTDKDGKARFFSLRNGTYYVDVKKENATNWEGKYSVSINSWRSFSLNSEFIIITNNESGLLASAQGKKWQATQFFLNGSDVSQLLDDCEKDDILIFYKGNKKGRYELNTQSKCNTNEPQIQTGTWQIDDLGTSISLSSNEKINLVSLSETQMIVIRNIVYFNQVFSVEVIYQSL